MAIAGLIFIVPILTFDIWLSATTGRRQIRVWLELRQWRQLAGAAAAGLALAVWLTFLLKFNYGPRMRIEGFPIPLVFFHLDDKTWTRTILPAWLPYLGGVTDFATGLAAPFIPYKVAEFLKIVKAELK